VTKGAARRSYVVAKMAIQHTPYLAKTPTDSAASPFQWTKDRRHEARRWGSAALARLSINDEAPGYLVDVADFGRPLKFFRVYRVSKVARFAHVEHQCCTFLGHTDDYDLYHHRYADDGGAMLVARYGDKAGHYYVWDQEKETSPEHAILRLALTLAKKRGLNVATAEQRNAPTRRRAT
jgi:hypothetical protein